MMSVPDYDLIKREVSSDLFTLLLVHEPDAALELDTTPLTCSFLDIPMADRCSFLSTDPFSQHLLAIHMWKVYTEAISTESMSTADLGQQDCRFDF